MNVLTVSKARASLYKLINQTIDNHEARLIKRKRHNSLLISEEGWSAIQETPFLLSAPGMGESIREGMATPLKETTEKLDW
jgi:antitoxin YefM